MDCKFDSATYPALCMAHFEQDNKDHSAMLCEIGSEEMEREIAELRAQVSRVYAIMRAYDGTVGSVSPLRTIIEKLQDALTEPPC